MSTGLLFVTAPEADHKAINLLLHNLTDWEYSKGDIWFRLVTTKNAYDLELPSGTNALDATPPSLDDTLDNAWAGSSLKDVEDFCLDVIHNDPNMDIGASLFIVVDSLGFQARNAILVEQAIGDEEHEFVALESFVKMRVPWSEVFSSWCNLNVSNSDFDEMGERREERGEWEGEEGGGEQAFGNDNDSMIFQTLAELEATEDMIKGMESGLDIGDLDEGMERPLS
ncbi:hypothetical protein Q7P36_000569 [Cladosporium allicinum]